MLNIDHPILISIIAGLIGLASLAIIGLCMTTSVRDYESLSRAPKGFITLREKRRRDSFDMPQHARRTR